MPCRSVDAAFRTIVLAGLAAAVAVPSSAQLGFDARLGGSIDSLKGVAGSSDTNGAAAGHFNPEYVFASDHGRVEYTLSAGSYSAEGDWTYFAHRLGGVYRLDLGSSEKLRLYLGGSADWRRNGDDWSYADYRALGGMANLEWEPRETLTFRGGYRFDARDFPELTALNQDEHSGFASVNLNLQTRTTLIGEVRFGAKAYEGETPVTIVEEPVSPTGTPSPSGRGAGSGRGLTSGVRTLVLFGEPTGEDARQLTWLARVAQSLGNRTGLSLQYHQRTTSGNVPPALVTVPPLFFDDGVYDDPYASAAKTWSGSLKQVFAQGAVIQLYGYRQRKDFNSALALGGDGLPLPEEPLREDRITRAGLELSLPFLSARTGSVALGLEIGYVYTDARSNDVYYDYTSHALGLGLTVEY
jgi:hypothetical protein